MTQRIKVCTDRILPKDMMRFQPTVGAREGAKRAIGPIGKTWMNGSTFQVRFMGGSSAQQDVARGQADWWAQVADLKFNFNNAPNAEIRTSFDSQDRAWSYIGTDCRSIPLNEATMNLGFLDGGTNEEVVIRECAKSPNFWDEEKTRHNVLRKYSVDQINGTAFDPKSIMLYFFPASWTLNGIGTEANDVLSSLDKEFIAGAKMYPRSGGTTVNATELKVNAPRRTQASIGKIGEEDLFRFTAKSDGSYVIDTRGPTD